MQATFPKGAAPDPKEPAIGMRDDRDDELDENEIPIAASAALARKPHVNNWRDHFRMFSSCTASAVGSPWMFMAAVAIVLVWALTGPIFKFSNTWQLVINTGTTIVTFLMVFLIQNTQNRDARAIHLKLDELIRGLKGPRNSMVLLEQASDEEIAEVEEQFKKLKQRRSGNG
jgi:low affinity Fe/Cu permease